MTTTENLAVSTHPLTPAIEYLAELSIDLDDENPAFRDAVRLAVATLEFARQRVAR